MTLANKAYDLIRADIIQGVHQPEAPLRLAELKNKYGMGYSPLREALNRLQSDRLVDMADLKGFRVAKSNLAEMLDAMTTRTEIEEQALIAAIDEGDDDWEAQIVSTLHALNRAADRHEEITALEARHFDFHRALIAACGSPWKLRFFEQLYSATERYRIPALTRQSNGPHRDIKAEHSALADATINRDSERARELLRQHYAKTTDWIAQQMPDA